MNIKKDPLSKMLLILLTVTLLILSSQQSYGLTQDGIETDGISPLYETEWMKPAVTTTYNWETYNSNPLGEYDQDCIYSDITGSWATASHFGFAIPYDAQIEGIEVMLLHATWNGNSGYYATIAVDLLWAGMTSSSNSISDTVGDAYSSWDWNFKNVTLGSPTNIWGNNDWTAQDYANDNFAVRIKLTDIYSFASESVDLAWVKVYYRSDIGEIDPPIDRYNTGWLIPQGVELDGWNSNVTNPLQYYDNYPAMTDSYSGWVKSTDYGINLPTDARIEGIEVNILHAPWNPDEGGFETILINLLNESMIVGTDKLDTADDYYAGAWDYYKNTTFGSSFDMWEHDWKAEDLVNGNFAVQIVLFDISSGDLVAVDLARVRVHYTMYDPGEVSITGETLVMVTTEDMPDLILDWHVTSLSADYTLMNLSNGMLLIDGFEYSFNYYGTPFKIENDTSVTINSNTYLFDIDNSSLMLGDLDIGTYDITLLVDNYHYAYQYKIKADFVTTLVIEEIPIILPSIDVQTNDTNFEFNYGDPIIFSGYAILTDPSNLGYETGDLMVKVNGSVVYEENWTNDTIYQIDVTDLIDNIEAIYQISIDLIATNGTHGIGAGLGFQMIVHKVDVPVETDTTDDTVDSKLDTDAETTPDLDLPFNLYYALFGIIMIGIFRRKRK